MQFIDATRRLSHGQYYFLMKYALCIEFKISQTTFHNHAMQFQQLKL